MKSHTLAKILLEQPNLDITTFANNHFCNSESWSENIKVGILKTKYVHGDELSIIIGNFDRREINGPESYIETIITGEKISNNYYGRNKNVYI